MSTQTPPLTSASTLSSGDEATSLHDFPLADPSPVPAKAHGEEAKGEESARGRRRMSLQMLFKKHFQRKSTSAAVHKPHPSHKTVPPEHGVLVHNNGRSRHSMEDRRPRRVSFSPSAGDDDDDESKEEEIEHAEEQREHAQSEAIAASRPKLKLMQRAKAQRKQEALDHSSKRRASVDGLSLAVNVPGEPLEPRRRVRSFSIDRIGVHLGVAALDQPEDETFDKGLPTRPRLTRQQVVAARHARTLEQIIIGNGSPAGALGSGNKDHEKRARKRKGDPTKCRPIPSASPKKVRALKRALLDVDTANDIIVQLRGMPQDSLAEPGSHKERIISAPPDGKEGNIIAVADQENRVAVQEPTSPAEKALHEIHRAHAPAEIQTRRSSLPVSARQSIHRDAKAQAPMKAVSLDCDEVEACRRHAEHLARMQRSESEPALPVVEPKDEQGTGPTSAKAIVAATGTGAALFGLGYWLKRSAPSVTPVGKAAQFSTEIVEDIQTGDASEMLKDTARLGVVGLEVVQPLAGKVAEGVEDQILGENKVSPDVPKEGQQEGGVMAVETLIGLPTLPPAMPSYGGPLAGVNPISLITSPRTTMASAAAQQAGAFDAIGAITGQVIQSANGGEEAMLEVHPPLDRLAIFVHWWGFELTMPRPTMNYLSTAHSISGAFMSFLQTMVVSGGVPELLPFVRYISQFMDMEFAAVKSQDKGQGVIVAATWLMPMALIPRPWDYATTAPSPAPAQPKAKTTAPSLASYSAQRAALHAPSSSTAPRPSPSNTSLGSTPVRSDRLPPEDVSPHYHPSVFGGGPGASGSNPLALSSNVDILDSLVELPEGSVRVKTALS